MPPSPSPPLTWWQILLLMIGGVWVWNFYSWGRQITIGLQYAAPGLGTMVGSLATLFSLLPSMLMMMMFMWMFSTFMKVFE